MTMPLAADLLSAASNEGGETCPERYALSWVGRRAALCSAQTPPCATLIPCYVDSVGFDQTRNLLLEGDNLEILKLLLKPYLGQVKMIYIDPPYNTGSDLFYSSVAAGRLAGPASPLLGTAPCHGRDHSAWLSMIYPRLCLARPLLREDGVILVSIDDYEVHNLRLIMDELLGEENFMASFVWRRRTGAQDAANNVSTDHEYVLCYGRHAAALTGQLRTFQGYQNPDGDPRGPWVSDNLTAAKPGGNTLYPVQDPQTGIQYWPPLGRYWPYSPATMDKKIAEGRILFPRNREGTPRLKRFQSEAKSLLRPVSTWISPLGELVESEEEVAVIKSASNTQGTREIRSLFGATLFPYAKPVSLIKALVEQGTSRADDIVLDFFAGSCTTAQAVLELNRQDGGTRQFILVQWPEPMPEGSAATSAGYQSVVALGKERMRRVIARLEGRGQRRRTLPANPAEDLGFRVFALGPSNVKDSDPGNLGPADHVPLRGTAAGRLVLGWTAQGVLYELMLKKGYRLSSQVTAEKTCAGNTVYRVIDPLKARVLQLCLDAHLDPSIVSCLAASPDHPFVCRAAALTEPLAQELAHRTDLMPLSEPPLRPAG